MTGHCPRQPVLPHPASGGLDYMILRGSFQPEMIQLFSFLIYLCVLSRL